MCFDLCGYNLYQLIKHNRNNLKEENVKKITIQLLKSVKVLHSTGYMHTDIKPENILINMLNKNLDEIIKGHKKYFNPTYDNIKKYIFNKKQWDLNNKAHKKI